MTRLTVEPGSCGFTTEITATMEPDGNVSIRIFSDCGHLECYADEVQTVDPMLAVQHRSAGQTPLVCPACHASCIVPVACLRAIEVEAGLALPRDVQIRFLEPLPNGSASAGDD